MLTNRGACLLKNCELCQLGDLIHVRATWFTSFQVDSQILVLAFTRPKWMLKVKAGHGMYFDCKVSCKRHLFCQATLGKCVARSQHRSLCDIFAFLVFRLRTKEYYSHWVQSQWGGPPHNGMCVLSCRLGVSTPPPPNLLGCLPEEPSGCLTLYMLSVLLFFQLLFKCLCKVDPIIGTAPAIRTM